MSTSALKTSSACGRSTHFRCRKRVLIRIRHARRVISTCFSARAYFYFISIPLPVPLSAEAHFQLVKKCKNFACLKDIAKFQLQQEKRITMRVPDMISGHTTRGAHEDVVVSSCFAARLADFGLFCFVRKLLGVLAPPDIASECREAPTLPPAPSCTYDVGISRALSQADSSSALVCSQQFQQPPEHRA